MYAYDGLARTVSTAGRLPHCNLWYERFCMAISYGSFLYGNFVWAMIMNVWQRAHPNVAVRPLVGDGGELRCSRPLVALDLFPLSDAAFAVPGPALQRRQMLWSLCLSVSLSPSVCLSVCLSVCRGGPTTVLRWLASAHRRPRESVTR